MKAYKLLKAYKSMDLSTMSGWLHAFSDFAPPIVYVRAFVHHSLTTDEPLEVYVAINSCSGDVYSAKCNCVSGLGQACNHVAALLFYLEHHSGKAELPVELSKTSKPMEWNRPSKKVVQPAHANDIAFHKPAHGEAATADDVVVHPRSGFDPRAPEDRVLHEDALHELLESVQ